MLHPDPRWMAGFAPSMTTCPNPTGSRNRSGFPTIARYQQYASSTRRCSPTIRSASRSGLIAFVGDLDEHDGVAVAGPVEDAALQQRLQPVMDVLRQRLEHTACGSWHRWQANGRYQLIRASDHGPDTARLADRPTHQEPAGGCCGGLACAGFCRPEPFPAGLQGPPGATPAGTGAEPAITFNTVARRIPTLAPQPAPPDGIPGHRHRIFSPCSHRPRLLPLVARTAITSGWRTASGACAGIAVGNGVFIVAAFTGTAMLRPGSAGFIAVQLAGCGFLPYLRCSCTRVRRCTHRRHLAERVVPTDGGRAAGLGALSALLNPKNALFYATLAAMLNGPPATKFFYGACVRHRPALGSAGCRAGRPPCGCSVARALPWLERAAGLLMIALALWIAASLWLG